MGRKLSYQKVTIRGKADFCLLVRIKKGRELPAFFAIRHRIIGDLIVFRPRDGDDA